ncbi:hypothetical protein EPYR_02592 [Erwinia pyrifoliae DSM 12163]|nr:hypothetical protein EPYR_02592 [Erwinia pyrifoliae DSM 12163]
MLFTPLNSLAALINNLHQGAGNAKSRPHHSPGAMIAWS